MFFCNINVLYYFSFSNDLIALKQGLYNNNTLTKLHKANIISTGISDITYKNGSILNNRYDGITYNQEYINEYIIANIPNNIGFSTFLNTVDNVKGIINHPINIVGVYIKLKLPMYKLSNNTCKIMINVLFVNPNVFVYKTIKNIVN